MNSDPTVVRTALQASIQASSVTAAVEAALAAYTTRPVGWPPRAKRGEDRRDPIWRALSKHLLSVLRQSGWSLESPYPPEWGFPGGAPVEAVRNSQSVDPQAPEFLPFIGKVIDIPCSHWNLAGTLVYPAVVLGLAIQKSVAATGSAPVQRCWELSINQSINQSLQFILPT